MPSSSPNENLNARRKVLGAMASMAGISAAGLLGAGAEGALAMAPRPVAAPPPPDELFEQARFRNYKSRRSSSWDHSGGNADAVPVESGASATILEVSGAGVITHLWFTIASSDEHHLKNLLLRAWWDGEQTPSVEVPIGDFFCLGLGEYFTFQSALVAVAPVKALNAYFQMPFATAAKLTVTNEGKIRTDSLYFAVDYVTFGALPPDVGRFHAQYRQATPTKGVDGSWKSNGDDSVNNRKNLDGADNYVYFEATGRGHFVGVTQSVIQNQENWFGEGDDMIFIDGDVLPTINGTGSEDYFNGAWDFGGRAFGYQHNGAPVISDPGEHIGGKYSLYRWHTESPITFEKSIKVTIEHGHANVRSDSFFSTAYWYQTEPHAAFPPLPRIEDRIPKVLAVSGPGAAPAGS